MTENEKNDFQNIALLIDAENTPHTSMKDVIEEISKFGRIVIKRAYADWHTCDDKTAKALNDLAIKAVQQFSFIKGKNTSDFALYIDAMDLLHENQYDAFAIVSSDSDFSPLAIRLKESGVFVIGVGGISKTIPAFRNACSKFISLENLSKNEISKETTENQKTISDKNSETDKIHIEEIHDLLKKFAAEEKYQDSEGFVRLSDSITYITRVRSDFNVKDFGFKKSSDFLNGFPSLYEIKKEQGKGTVTIIKYRVKDAN